jgi:hypothetical protein
MAGLDRTFVDLGTVTLSWAAWTTIEHGVALGVYNVHAALVAALVVCALLAYRFGVTTGATTAAFALKTYRGWLDKGVTAGCDAVVAAGPGW